MHSLLGQRDFLKFWVGQSVSVFGSQFSPLAIQTIAIQMLGADSIQLGILAFLNTISFLSLGLLAGVWVDKHSRKRTMILADIGRALTLLLVPLSSLMLALTMNLLYLVTLVSGILTLFFEISYQAYVPSLVERSRLVEANSKLEVSRSSAQVVGPTLAGFAITTFSAPLAVLADTFGYTSSALSLGLIRKAEVISASGTKHSTWHDIREGLSVVLGDSRLRAIAGCTATTNFFSSAYGAILLKYYYDSLNMTPVTVGLVFGVGSLGGLLGAVLSSRLTAALGVGRAIISGSVVSNAFMTAVYFASPQSSVLIVAVATFLTTLGILLYNIPQVSFRQALVPQHIQGRMNATMRTIVWGTLPLGGIAGGILGQTLGIRPAIGLATALSSLSFLWVFLSPVRKISEMPTPE